MHRILALFVGLSVFGLALGSLHAEETPAVLNAPSEAATEAKAVVNRLEPTAEVVYNITADDWQVGVSTSLYSFRSENIHLGRVKTGYLSSNIPFAGLDVDVPGLLTRYGPGTDHLLAPVLNVLTKYGAVGYLVGWDVEGKDVAHGPTFGVTARF